MERLQLKAGRGVYVGLGYICTIGLLLCYIVLLEGAFTAGIELQPAEVFIYDYMITSTK